MASSELGNFILGNYNLTDVLGVGAMGFVYRARQLNLDRDVAVKILSPNLAHETDYMALFIREARTAASLEHPHIVPIFDYGIQDDMSYVAMRLLTGGSLGDRLGYRLEHNLPMPSLAEISQILNQAASALDYAHEHGVIHRDIKPNNLMFDQHGVAYIVDFGIAKLVGTTSSIKGGTFLGTPSFMAPEQWEGLPPTPAIDQYALAAVVYMMVTGRAPFEADVALALMKKHLSETPADVRDYRPDAPEQVNAVLQQAMAKQPTERFPSNRAFAEAFALAIHDAVEKPASSFASFVLPHSSFGLPMPKTGRTSANPNTETVPSPDLPVRQTKPANSRARNIIIAIQSGLLILAIVLIALLLSRQPPPAADTPTQVAVLVLTSEPSATSTIAAVDPTDEADLISVSLSTAELVPPSSTSSPTETSTTAPSATVLPTTQAPSVTPTATASPTQTNTATHTATALPSATPTPLPSSTPTATATHTASPAPTAIATATFTATITPSPTPTETPTETPTVTATTGSVAPRPTVNWGAGTQLRINNASGVWLRTRPSGRAAQVATLANNNPVVATGNRQYDGRQWWWEVTAEWGAVGWVEQFALVQQ